MPVGHHANDLDHFATFLTVRSEDGCHAHRKRILIVDDSKTMTAIVFQILKDANYTDIDGFTTVPVRSQHCVKEYDLVITDWQMQPISGGAYKADQSGCAAIEVRVILITGLYAR